MNNWADRQGFTDQEAEGLIMAAVNGTPGGVSEEQIAALWKWVHQVRIQHALVGLLLKGDVWVEISDGSADGWVFKHPKAGGGDER